MNGLLSFNERFKLTSGNFFVVVTKLQYIIDSWAV